MLSRLLQRPNRFFNLYSLMASHLVEGAKENGMLVRDLSQTRAKVQRLKELERRGDDVTHQTLSLLRNSFTTPLDRNDMHLLAGELNKVLDAIETAGQRVFLYDVKELPSEVYQLAELGVTAAEQVQAAVEGLSQMKTSEPVLRACSEINRLESQAQEILQNALSRLFRSDADSSELLKLKEVCERFRSVASQCEQVGKVIDRIVLAEGV